MQTIKYDNNNILLKSRLMRDLKLEKINYVITTYQSNVLLSVFNNKLLVYQFNTKTMRPTRGSNIQKELSGKTQLIILDIVNNAIVVEAPQKRLISDSEKQITSSDSFNSSDSSDDPFTWTQPIQPMQPTQPMQPMQPIQPIQPMQPTQPTQPIAAAKPKGTPLRTNYFCTPCNKYMCPSSKIYHEISCKHTLNEKLYKMH